MSIELISVLLANRSDPVRADPNQQFADCGGTWRSWSMAARRTGPCARFWSRSRSFDAIVSMPSGVFRPYAGVSTAILLFTKTNSGGTDDVWFYDMQADGKKKRLRARSA